jgi:hypothetical protein
MNSVKAHILNKEKKFDVIDVSLSKNRSNLVDEETALKYVNKVTSYGTQSACILNILILHEYEAYLIPMQFEVIKSSKCISIGELEQERWKVKIDNGKLTLEQKLADVYNIKRYIEPKLEIPTQE